MPELPELQSYALSEKLGESLQTLVYKGYYKSQPDTPLILKLLKFLSCWDDQSRHLRQKIERLKVLHDPRACTPLSLEVCSDMQFIVQPAVVCRTAVECVDGATKQRHPARFFYYRLHLGRYFTVGA